MLADTKPFVAALIALGMFFAGGALGELLSFWRAPDSGVVAMISFLALPGAFMLSMVIWQGFTIFVGLLNYLRGRRQTIEDRSPSVALARKAWLLVPAPVVFAAFTGIVAGVLGESGFIGTTAIYTTTGFAYGMCCFWMGRAGLLPILSD